MNEGPGAEDIVDAGQEVLLRDEPSMVGVGSYRGYEELQQELAELGSMGARLAVIGETVEGNPINALELGPEGASELRVLLAGVHAMEWIGVEVLMSAVRSLVDSPPETHRVIVVPVVNVDGYIGVEADLRAGRRVFRRGNANGVDLNRNWPTHFKKRLGRTPLRRCLGHSGVSPCSEPEVAAVEARLQMEVAKGASVARALSLHSFGRVVLYPFGGRWAAPEEVDQHLELGREINQHMERPYRVVQCARWFPGLFAHGMELDHFYLAYGAHSMLIECSSGGMSWRRPSSLLHPFRWFNPPDPASVVPALSQAVRTFCADA